VPADVKIEATAQRAREMLYSDQWARSGMDERSALFESEEKASWEGCKLLRPILLEQKGRQPSRLSSSSQRR